MSLAQSDAIREVLDRLDLEDQLQAERAMQQALDAHVPFEPSPEDFAELDLWLERLEMERDCNMRFSEDAHS